MENIKISKELFINSINLIEKQFVHDVKCADAAEIIFPTDFISGYDNHYLLDGILDILKISLNDNHKDSWIEYFIYDLEFGKKYADGCATYKNGNNIDISTTEKLYNYLTE